MVYTALVVRRLRTQHAYNPVFEDWLFHVLLPFVSYALLAVAAYEASTYPRVALFIVAAAVLVLLFVGIHNAWDAVTYHVFVRRKTKKDRSPGSSSGAWPSVRGRGRRWVRRRCWC